MPSLDEVGAQEPLLHLELETTLLGVVKELVRLQGVGVLQGFVVVLETCSSGDADDPVDHRPGLVGRHAAMAHQELDLGPGELDRRVRSQLEAVIDDLDLRAAVKPAMPLSRFRLPM